MSMLLDGRVTARRDVNGGKDGRRRRQTQECRDTSLNNRHPLPFRQDWELSLNQPVTKIRITPDEPVEPGTTLLFGLPPHTPEQRVLTMEVSGAQDIEEVAALNSRQTAFRMTSVAGACPAIEITFSTEAASFPDWVFNPTGGAHETPSIDLHDLMAGVAPLEIPSSERVARIVRHVEERFTYGVRDVGLGDDHDAMPALACDTHLGTCVDTHSYAVAAMRAAGIPAAYVSGLFFPEDHTTSAPGHCWFVVQAKGAPHHWDISHFLKYSLGPVRPVFNPKPGIRFAMSIGRDLVFETQDGPVTLARLSGFNILDGATPGKKLATRADIV